MLEAIVKNKTARIIVEGSTARQGNRGCKNAFAAPPYNAIEMCINKRKSRYLSQSTNSLQHSGSLHNTECKYCVFYWCWLPLLAEATAATTTTTTRDGKTFMANECTYNSKLEGTGKH